MSHQPFGDKERFNILKLKSTSPFSNCFFSEECIIMHRNVIIVKTVRLQRCCLLMPAFQKAALPKIKEESEIIEVIGIFWQMTFQRKISFFPNLKMPLVKNVSLMEINVEKKIGIFF